VQRADLGRSGSLDLDYHTLPAHSEREPLGRRYLSRRSRRRAGGRGFNPHHPKDPSYYPLTAHLAKRG